MYLPFGGSQRCDLIFEDESGLHRVQVKNGVLRDRTVNFATCSHTKNIPKDYIGQIDFFGVYCHDLAAAFLVPISDVPPRAGRLRVGSPLNCQQRNIRWAEQFRLDCRRRRWSSTSTWLGHLTTTDRAAAEVSARS